MDRMIETIRHFVLSEHLKGEAPEALRADTPLQTSGILDSLAALGLVAFVEREFGVELDVYDTSIEHFDTLQDIARTITRKQAARTVAVRQRHG